MAGTAAKIIISERQQKLLEEFSKSGEIKGSGLFDFLLGLAHSRSASGT